MNKLTRIATAAVAAALALPAVAAATIGTGVGATPIELSAPIVAGGSYKLPQLLLVNTGTVQSRYHARIEELSPGSGKPVPATWVTFARNDLRLAPRHRTYVPITLGIPSDAPAGRYVSDIVAGTKAPHAVGGTALGAASATVIRFTVQAKPGGGLPGWLPIAAGGLLAALALSYGVKRSGLRLAIHRN